MYALPQVLLGFALLAFGGECLIRGSVGLARRLGLSELVIGLTVIGFGTSAPELVTSIDAALQGAPGITLGSIVGSNISNVLFVFAVVVIVRPMVINPSAIRRDGAIAVAAAFALAAIGTFSTEIDRLTGLCLVVALLLYMALVWRAEHSTPSIAEIREEGVGVHQPTPRGLGPAVTLSIIGLGALIYGADQLVNGAIVLASVLGLSDAVIGLTIIAVGTSLPELVTSLMAAWRRKYDVAFGSIVGSNIYNIFGILGVTALIHPIAVSRDIGAMNWVLLVASPILLLAFASTGQRIQRMEGVALLICYFAYIASLIV